MDGFGKLFDLTAPPDIKDIKFDTDATKEYYLEKRLREVKIDVVPESTKALKRNTQAKRKQYGLRHQVTSTIHDVRGGG